jgi:ATP-dependent helicase/nuclease subunit A
LLRNTALSRFFDPQQFSAAANEVPLVLRSGEQRRIDRLIEFENEVWVLDYKTGTLIGTDEVTLRGYQMQITEYRDALRSVYPDRKVSGAIVFADADMVCID